MSAAGIWTLTVHTPVLGDKNFDLILKSLGGGKLSGTMHEVGNPGKPQPIKNGFENGSTIGWGVDATDESPETTFNGTVNGNSMKGKAFALGGDADFDAKRS